MERKQENGVSRHFTYSNVMSTLAVFLVVAGGTAVAAKINGSKIESGTVKNKALKTDTIKSNKLRDGKAVADVDVIPNSLTGAAIDESSLVGVPVTGPAGGDLTGTYPNPLIGNNTISTDKLQDDAVTTPKIADNAVNSAKIDNATITQGDLAPNSVGTAQLQTKVFFAKVQYNAANPVILAASPGVTSQGEGAPGFPRIGFPQSMNNCAITATTSAAAGTSIVRHSSNSAGSLVQLAIQDGANAAVRQDFSVTGIC